MRTRSGARSVLVAASLLASACGSAVRASPPAQPGHPVTSQSPPGISGSVGLRLAGVGEARQLVAVSAPAYGDTAAELAAFERSGSSWRRVFGPWSVEIGSGGFAPPGAKTEGDGRTPSGTYGFGFFFGVEPDPGVSFPYRQVTGPSIVWDDDPASPLYNQWVDDAAQDPGARPEPMDNPPAYDYGAVIDYNAARTPGRGSAIFLHASTGSPTAGCVALPTDELLELLRWLAPSEQPRIAMGVSLIP